MTPTFLVQAAGEMMMPFTEMETRARIVNRERDWEFLFCYVKFGFLVDFKWERELGMNGWIYLTKKMSDLKLYT